MIDMGVEVLNGHNLLHIQASCDTYCLSSTVFLARQTCSVCKILEICQEIDRRSYLMSPVLIWSLQRVYFFQRLHLRD
jgi:hypothetical protein